MLNQQDQNHSAFERNKKSFGEESIITKISNHLEMHRATIQTFWLSERNCASAKDIIQFCKQCGLELDTHDCILLKGELFTNNETITLDRFVKYIPYWSQQGKEVVKDFHMKRSEKLIHSYEYKGKERARSGLMRQKSSLDHKTVARQNSASGFRREGSANTINKNNSLSYLKKYKERELIKEKQLSQNIQKNKIDQEYAMLLKMSQLNSINKQKINNIAYRAYKSAEGIIKVRIFNLNKFEKEISLKEFDTIYKNFKKTQKENKDWTIPPSTLIKQNDELQILKNRNNQKSERQQQLKNLLVNTVNLTNLLKQQIKIFKMKGIYGCQNI